MSTEGKRWFVAQAVRNREQMAALSVIQHGFEGYLPEMLRQRRIGGKVIEVPAPRFGVYVFVRFDRYRDPWPRLMAERGKPRYFQRVLCNADGVPVPVPERAMDAIRSYKPPKTEATAPIVYTPGQRVSCIVGGVRLEGVFESYLGNRQFVRTWFFGREHLTEVCSADLEPLDLDIAV